MPELTLKIAIGARLSAANEELELSIAVMSLALALDHKLASRTPISTTTTVPPDTATSGKSVTRRGYLVLYEPDAADDDEPSASPS